MKQVVWGLSLFLMCTIAMAQEKYTLSGYVKDMSNGETLIGATVLVQELGDGNITNLYGYYSLTLPPGSYTVKYSYVGYETVEKSIVLNADQKLDIEIPLQSEELEAVVVSGRAENANVSDLEMSTSKMDIKTIKKIPAFLGEVDVVASLQRLPGVSSVGEGASGFNIRGGSVGQNLILLDEAPVYNSAHLFGFFSVFNPDAVKSYNLYKGGIPAEYGGRLSSILDVRMKEGNIKNYEVNGGIGTIFTRLAVEGPIKKQKSSFIVAARRSYIDVLAKPFLDEDFDGVGLYFYDLTAKANYYFNEKNRLYISGYLGRDDFNFDTNQGFDWGNQTATLRWNHLFSDKLFSNTTYVWSHYDYAFQVGENADDEFKWKSDIYTYTLKEQFTYFLNPKNELSFGGEATFYRFLPADVEGSSAGERSDDLTLDTRKSLELAAYIGNKQQLTNALAVEYGLRFSSFTYLGSGTVFTYNDTIPGVRRTAIAEEEAGNFEKIKSYSNWEPRLALNYQINPSTSIKASYQRMSQYIHLISNTAATLPTDVWMPSTNNLKPQIGDQIALGLFKNFRNNRIETFVEGYYKYNRNQVDYIDGADLLINPKVEGDLIAGSGRAYGLEFYVAKNTGKVNGWVSYTIGRSELLVDGVNENRWYPARYDQTHNVKITTIYDINPKVSLSTSFTYITGTPFTLPSYRYEIQGMTIPGVQGRNNSRIPDYHRLDLSLTLQTGRTKRNGKERFFGLMKDSYWVFTVYNFYGRENPFSIYFGQGSDRIEHGALAGTSATQVAILGTFLPAISYNFKF